VQNADQVDVEYLGKAANGIEAGPIVHLLMRIKNGVSMIF